MPFESKVLIRNFRARSSLDDFEFRFLCALQCKFVGLPNRFSKQYYTLSICLLILNAVNNSLL